MQLLVENYWDATAGPGAYAEKFDDVAKLHYKNYVDIIIDKNGELPDSSEIELSYRKSVTENGLPARTAIDGAVTQSIAVIFDYLYPGEKHEGLDWTDMVGMEDERQVPSEAFNDLGFWKSLGDLIVAGAFTVFEKLIDASLYLWETLQEIFQELVNDIIDASLYFWETLQEISQELMNDIIDALTETITFFEKHEKDILDFLLGISKTLQGIFDEVSDLFAQSRATASPLVFDLDGDGIEIAQLSRGATLFDHDANGVKTGSAWLKSDDAILVLDRNDNGVIDSGRELFGNNTLLASGNTAKDGYAALAELDSNGDGLITAQDTQYGNLRLWRDLDQDGASEVGELFTLAELGISQIDLTKTAKTTTLADGTKLDGSASFVIDGKTHTYTDAWFAQNAFYRDFTDTMELTEAAQLLPDIQGAGAARDLREAASLDAALVATIQGFTGLNRSDMQAQIDVLIHQWASTADFQTSREKAHDMGVQLLLTPQGVSSAEMNAVKSVTAGLNKLIALKQNNVSEERFNVVWAEVERLGKQLDTLEIFNGQTLYTFTDDGMSSGNGTVSFTAAKSSSSAGDALFTGDVPVVVYMGPYQYAYLMQSYDALKESVYSGLVLQTRLKDYLDSIDLIIDEGGLRFDISAMVIKLETYKVTNAQEALTDLAELVRYAHTILQPLGFEGLEMLDVWVGEVGADTSMQATLAEMNIFTGSALSGTSRPDIYLGDAANNTFSAGLGNDVLRGSAGADYFLGETGNDIMDGGAGNDVLNGGEGNDMLNGGEGNDNMDGGEGNDMLNGGEGNDNMDGGEGNDMLNGGAGNDMLNGGEGNDTMDGGAGNDTLYGGIGNNIYLFGKGGGQDLIGYQNDTTVGKLNILQFEAGINADDILASRSGNDLILSIAGSTDKVTLQYFFYGDTPGNNAYNPIQQVRFADGSSWDMAMLRAKALAGTSGNDNLTGMIDADTLNGGGGNDYLYGRTGDDVLLGGDGNDYLYGEAGNDILNGGVDNDVLNGGEGNDTMDGGAGNDTLYGGIGNNIYLFGKGGGQDLIGCQNDTTVGKLNILQFEAGVTADDILASRSGNDLILSIAGSTDKVTLQYFFYGDTPGSHAYNPIQQVRFADGSSWDMAMLTFKALAGMSGNDTLIGLIDADTLNGGGGNDNLYGRAGDDVLQGGEGNDSLYGEAGNDILDGGVDNDVLNGGEGNDTMDGGAGNDTLYGGIGNNIYLFGKGGGQDLIGYQNDTTVGKLNILQFEAGVTADDILASRSGNDLILSIAGSTDKVTLQYFFYGDTPGNNAYNPIQQVRFADGSSWDMAMLRAKALAGTSGNDNLTGMIDADTLNGGGGNDNLYGRAGDDVLQGGEGNDSLYGEAGDDILDGGVGNDNLYGGIGNNIYLFGKGGGQDLIGYQNDTTAGKLNILQFEAGVTADDILASRSGNDLILSIAGSTDRVTLQYFFYGNTPGSHAYNPIQQVRFADGSSWDMTMLTSKALAGTSGNDTLIGLIDADTLNGGGGSDNLYGRAGDDVLQGGEGNDSLYGEAGDDILDGGAGNDTLNGGEGNDTMDGGSGNDTLYGGIGNNIYLFGKGGGQDLIGCQNDTTVGKLNILQFEAGVTADDILASRSGNDLILSIAGSTDKVTLQYFFYGDTPGSHAYNPIQQVRFADGSSWDMAMLTFKALAGMSGNDTLIGLIDADTLNGGGGSDNVYGRAGDDVLQGGDGNDSLYGEAGDDILDGGAGNDYLYGGIGNNIYLFGKGGGQDLIGYQNDTTAGKLNILQFEAGVTADDILASRSGNDLILSIAGSTDKVTLQYFFYGDTPGSHAYNPIQQVRFADGSSWDMATLVGKALAGTSGNDTLIGMIDADTLNGGGGSDNLYGRAGDDVLQGGDGNDSLYGEAGDDILDGEAGNDSLNGGIGADAYVFSKGDGQDSVYDNQGDNVIRFQDVIQDEIRIERSGNNLKIFYGESDSVTIQSSFYSNSYQMASYEFADGKSLTTSELLDKYPLLSAV